MSTHSVEWRWYNIFQQIGLAHAIHTAHTYPHLRQYTKGGTTFETRTVTFVFGIEMGTVAQNNIKSPRSNHAIADSYTLWLLSRKIYAVKRSSAVRFRPYAVTCSIG